MGHAQITLSLPKQASYLSMLLLLLAKMRDVNLKNIHTEHILNVLNIGNINSHARYDSLNIILISISLNENLREKVLLYVEII